MLFQGIGLFCPHRILGLLLESFEAEACSAWGPQLRSKLSTHVRGTDFVQGSLWGQRGRSRVLRLPACAVEVPLD